MVHECLKAADELAKSGKKAGVIDAYGLPLKDTGILDIAAKSGGRIVTVEDNYTGGLDSEIAEQIAASGSGLKLKALFVHQIPKSGREPQEVLDYLQLGFKAIVAAV
jgi:transketolase